MARSAAGPCLSILLVALAGFSAPAAGQGPVRVKDIAPGMAGPRSTYVSLPVRFKGRDYFGANDGFLGKELWSTDGTEQGVRLVADLCPGSCWGAPEAFTVSGDYLYFTAANSPYGYNADWLWRTDGTAAGTIPLVNLSDHTDNFGLATFLAPFEGGVVFNVYDRPRRGWSLWRSNGTRAGTGQITQLPGFNDFIASPPHNFDWPRGEGDPGKHYFTWQKTLWATDGTAAGTGAVPTPIVPCGDLGQIRTASATARILPAGPRDSKGARQELESSQEMRARSGDFAQIGRLVVYSGFEGQQCEPWVSDGTAHGTRRLRHIQTGRPNYPGSFFAAGGLVYFLEIGNYLEQYALWKTDGTLRGTVRVRASSAPGELNEVSIVATSGSTVYFVANDGVHGRELWRTDGDPYSTQLVADLSPGRRDTTFGFEPGLSTGGQIFFAAVPRGGAGREFLFRTRGTPNTTRRLAELGAVGPSEVREVSFSMVGGRPYFATYFGDATFVLGSSDGTVPGTRILDLPRTGKSSNPHQLIAGTGGLAFLADDGRHGFDLWRSGGHPEDTEPLADLVEDIPDYEGLQLYPGAGGAFFETVQQERIGWTDGRTVRDFHKRISGLRGFVDLGDRAIFFAPTSTPEPFEHLLIWSSDGTSEGTGRVALATDLLGDYTSFQVRATRRDGSDEALYLVLGGETEPLVSDLSVTDGTAAGTHAVTPFPVDPGYSLGALVAAGPNVFLELYDFREESRESLRVTDGTVGGTREVYSSSGPFGFIDALTAVGERVFFVADDVERGSELWVSDGSLEGTRRVADIAPGPASSFPTWLTAWGDRILFSADDGRHGLELWISDGTEGGTRRLEIHRGPKGAFPHSIRVIGDRAVFAADDGVHGSELWVTDGTPEGTRLAADVMPGPISSSPSSLAVVGDELFMNAGRPNEGYELWKLPLAALR
ncbi:MAG: ELWxxDGT repeat protein [Acidobacteriota bacterium]